jgi:RHS repeat-associated protein
MKLFPRSWQKILTTLGYRQAKGKKQKIKRRRASSCEQLESRQVLTTFVTFDTPAATVDEGYGTLWLSFTRSSTDSSELQNQLNVGLEVVEWAGLASPFAKHEIDFNMVLGVSFPGGVTTASTSVTIVNDTSDEPTEYAHLHIISGVDYTPGSTSLATITIEDNDGSSSLPTLQITATDSAASEAGPQTGTYQITRSDSNGTITVPFSMGGSAGSGDYKPLGTITIPDGDYSTTVTLTPVPDDEVNEGTETATMTISAPSGYSVSANYSSASIDIADGPALPTLTLGWVRNAVEADNRPGGAAETEGYLKVYRDNTGPTQIIDVSLQIAQYYGVQKLDFDDSTFPDGIYSALDEVPNGDWAKYVQANVTLYFGNGFSYANIFMNPADDNLAEFDEAMQFTLLPPSSNQYYHVGGTSSASMFIVDADRPQASVEIAVNGDAFDEDKLPESNTTSPTRPYGDIIFRIDTPPASGTSATVKFKITSPEAIAGGITPPIEDYSLVAISGATLTKLSDNVAGNDYWTVTFPSGATEARVQIFANSDGVSEPSGDLVTVELDALYLGQTTPYTVKPGYGSDSVTLVDTYTSPQKISIDVIKDTTHEGDGVFDSSFRGRLKIKRDASSSSGSSALPATTVQLQIGGTATPDQGILVQDYDLQQQGPLSIVSIPISNGLASVTFAEGESEKTLYVRAWRDSIDEVPETVEVEILPPTTAADELPAYVVGSPSEGTVTIEDETPSVKHCTCTCGGCGATSVVLGMMDGAAFVIQKALNLANGALNNPHPVIATDYSPSSTISTAVRIEATLEFNVGTNGSSTWQKTVYYGNGGGGITEGMPVRIAVQADAVDANSIPLPTGRYSWRMTVREAYQSGYDLAYKNEKVFTGFQDIVNDRASEFGNRWMQRDLDRLYLYTSDSSSNVSPGILMRSGDGNTYWFSQLPDSTYRSSLGDTQELAISLVVGPAPGTADDYYRLADQSGNESHFSRDTLLLTSRIDALGNTTTYEYTDANGDSKAEEIWKITDPIGNQRIFVYDVFENPNVTNDVRYLVTQIQEVFDGTNTRTTDLGYTWYYPGVRSDPYLTSVELPSPTVGAERPRQEFAYDSNTGLLNSTTEFLADAANPTAAPVVTTLEYYDTGATYTNRAVKSITHGDDRTFYNVAGARGLVALDQPNSTTQLASLTPESSVTTTITDPDGRVTSYTFDAFGNIVSTSQLKTETTPDQWVTTTITRDEDGRVIQIDEPQVSEGTTPSNKTYTTNFVYDEQARLRFKYYPDRTNYSGNAHAASTTDASYEEWRYEADTDTPTYYRDRLGRITIYMVESGTGNILAIQQVVGTQDALVNNELPATSDDVLTKFAYTTAASDPTLPRGLLKKITDPLGRETTFQYDVDGNLRFVYFPDGTHIENTYTVFDQIETALDEVGRVTTYEHDALDRLTKIIFSDPYNSTVTPGLEDSKQAPYLEYQYDRMGRMTGEHLKTWNVSGSAYEDLTYTTYVYNTLNQLAKVRLPDHDGIGGESVTGFQYTDAGQLYKTTDARSNTSYAYYDSLGRLEYTRLPHPTDVGTETGPQTQYKYDDLGRVIETITPRTSTSAGHATTTNFTTKTYYENWGQRIIVRSQIVAGDNDESNWAESLYDYNKVGLLTYVRERVAKNPDGTYQYRETRYVYDRFDRLYQVIEADKETGLASLTPSVNSRVTTYRYDKAGNLKLIIDNNHRSATLALSAAPLRDSIDLTAANLEAANATEFYYDSRDRLTERRDIDPDGDHATTFDRPTWKYKYYDDGRLKESIDPLGFFTTETDPIGRSTKYQYDGLGRLWKVTEPDPDYTGGKAAPVQTYRYDDAGRIAFYTDPTGQQVRYKYDLQGNLIRRLDPDPDGTGPDKPLTEPITDYTYDAVGNLETLTDPVGNTTTWTYNNLDQAITETNELGKVRSFSYDFAGNLLSETNRNSQTLKYSYDGLGNQTSEQWFDGTGSLRLMQFSYNLASELKTVRDNLTDSAGNLGATAGADYDYFYNGRGDLEEEQQEIAGLSTYTAGQTDTITLQHDYDVLGRLTAARYGGTDAVGGLDYTRFGTTTFDLYDELSRLKTMHGFVAGSEKIDFRYYADSKLESITRDVFGAGNFELVSSYAYDANGRLTSLKHERVTHGVVESKIAGYTLTWDIVDRNYVVASYLDGQITYAYDRDNQLLSATYANGQQANEAYTYDANGNRITAGGITYQRGTNNRVLSDGTYSYGYDDEGNMTSRTDLASGEYTQYVWDSRNRLTGVLTYTDSTKATLTKEVALKYDAFDRLIGKTVDADGAGSGVGVDTYYAYDGTQVALQFDETSGDVDELTHRYLWGPGIDQLLADEQVASGNTYYGLGDLLGTIRDLAQWNSATNQWDAVEHRKYDAFGNLVSDNNAAVDELFAFTGRMYDQDIGLQYNWKRWYNPRIGQWMSEDPIGFAGGDENLRRYVGNHPTIATDPNGLEEWPWWEGTKAFFGSIGNNVYGAGEALVTGEAGWAMGERAVAMAERSGRGPWKGSAGDWGQFSWHMTGEVLGTNCMAEGLVGTDMATGRGLDGTERGTRFAGGVGAFAGMAAGGARFAPIKYSALPGSALVARATAPVANVARGIGGAVAARLPAPVTAAASAVGRALSADLGAMFKGGWKAFQKWACDRLNNAPNTMRGAPTNLGPVGSKAPYQVMPGIRELEGHYINDLGHSQPWRAHYDQYGRLIGRTDYNAGNRAAGIPDIHYHTYKWGPGMTPMESGSHIPGEFVP